MKSETQNNQIHPLKLVLIEKRCKSQVVSLTDLISQGVSSSNQKQKRPLRQERVNKVNRISITNINCSSNLPVIATPTLYKVKNESKSVMQTSRSLMSARKTCDGGEVSSGTGNSLFQSMLIKAYQTQSTSRQSLSQDSRVVNSSTKENFSKEKQGCIISLKNRAKQNSSLGSSDICELEHLKRIKKVNVIMESPQCERDLIFRTKKLLRHFQIHHR